MPSRSGVVVGLVLSARIALAKDPCPEVPAEDVRACTALGARTSIRLDELGAVGMDERDFYAFSKSTLVKVPRTGGASTVVAADVGGVEPDASFSSQELVVGDTSLYWSTLDGIFSVRKSGGEIATLYDAAERGHKVFDLVSDGKSLYWADSSYEIWQMSLRTKQPRRLVRRHAAIEQLVRTRDRLVWIEPDDKPRLVVLSPETGALRTYVLDEEVFDMAADDRYAYVGTIHALSRVALGSGATQVVVKQSAEVVRCGDASVYFVPYAGDCGGGHLMKVAKTGGAAVQLEQCPSVRNLMLRDGRLFFVGPKGIVAEE